MTIMRRTKKPALPRARSQDPGTNQLLSALTESYEVGEGVRGNPLDKKLTLRDLEEIGLVQVQQLLNQNALNVQPTFPLFLPAIPPAPTGFTVTGAFSIILLEWDNPYFIYGNHARTEIYRSDTNDFGAAVLIGSSTGSMYADALGSSANAYYWVRFVSTSNVPGPINGVAGASGATAEDPVYLMEVLAEAYGTGSAAPFFQIDEPTLINGVLIPAGTYMKQAFIADATIVSAMIQSLAAEKIIADSLSAISANLGTITGGSLNINNKFIVDVLGNTTLVDATLRANYSAGVSGWQLLPNGSAEFRNIIARGDIEATTVKADAVNVISTLMLQGQAVTIPVSAYTSGSIGLSLNFATIQSVTITSTGAPIGIFVHTEISAEPSSGSIHYGYRLLRGTTNLLEVINIPAEVSGDFKTFISPIISDTPGVGTFTYYVQAYHNGINPVAAKRALILLETKR